MINSKKASGILRASHFLLMLGIPLFALNTFILHDHPVRQIDAPRSVPMNARETEPASPSTLKELPNPLQERRPPPPNEVVFLIGTDRIANDPTADTAYLFVVGRKINVNAYVGEPIRDEFLGREVAELAGWRLKRVTPSSAIFSTPAGEQILPIQLIAVSEPATGATDLLVLVEPQAPDSVRSLLDEAADLYKRGYLAEAASKIELALEFRPASGTIYAFMMRAGEDLVASIMNSRDERMRNLGHRLFELAKSGGERRRTRTL